MRAIDPAEISQSEIATRTIRLPDTSPALALDRDRGSRVQAVLAVLPHDRPRF